MGDHTTDFVKTNENKVIWRYIGFSKFVSMLSKRSLFFCRVDRLEDKYEGRYPNHWRQNYPIEESAFEAFAKNVFQEYKIDPNSPQGVELKKQMREAMVKGAIERAERAAREQGLVNCWCANEAESHAMWRLFLANEPGVAIKSTVGRLMYSLFNNTTDDFKPLLHPVIILPVTYYDPTEEVPKGILTASLKRRYFAYENEIRAFIAPTIKTENQVPPPGIDYPVNLESLITEVRVDAMSPPWFHEVVRATMDKFGLNKPLVTSDMA